MKKTTTRTRDIQCCAANFARRRIYKFRTWQPFGQHRFEETFNGVFFHLPVDITEPSGVPDVQQNSFSSLTLLPLLKSIVIHCWTFNLLYTTCYNEFHLLMYSKKFIADTVPTNLVERLVSPIIAFVNSHYSDRYQMVEKNLKCRAIFWQN